MKLTSICLAFFISSSSLLCAQGNGTAQNPYELFFADSVRSSMDNAWQKIYYYRSTNTVKQPLVVSLHQWSSGYEELKNSLAEETKQKNWHYIHPDFRGASNNPNAGGSDLAINDIDDAIEWAIQRFNVDASKIYVVGASGGGFATLCAYGRLKHKVASFTAWVPISDLGAWYYESLLRNKKYADNILAITNSSTDKLNQEEIEKRSPIYHDIPKERLKNVPLTILAGVHDGHDKNSVPVSQSLLYYNKLLTEKGVKDRAAFVSENDMSILLNQQRFPVKDSAFIGSRLILYQKSYQNIRVVIFEGGHEMLNNVGAILPSTQP